MFARVIAIDMTFLSRYPSLQVKNVSLYHTRQRNHTMPTATLSPAILDAQSASNAAILPLLWRFVASRPGFEPCNYADAASYRADMRSATRDRHDAETLLRYVQRTGYTVDLAAHMTERDRLTFDHARGSIDYTAGQYYPTEYRAAVCRALSNAIWAAWRADDTRSTPHTGDSLREQARNVFGRTMAARWFR